MVTAANWREQVSGRLVSPKEAMGAVKSGDTVWIGVLNSTATTLAQGLAERAADLRDVTVYNALSSFNWDRPDLHGHIHLVSGYTGPMDRQAVNEGRADYLFQAGFRTGRMPHGWHRPYDVAALPISPPDDDGYCSFGGAVFFSPVVVDLAPVLVGEIHHEFIRTGGDNRVHISRFQALCEAGPPLPVPIPPRSEETVYAAEVICTLTAHELVPDRTTLQVGLGDVSAALCLYLFDRHDLGIHTELLPGGVVDLVEAGVVTGKYKEVNTHKVVASVAAQLPAAELARIDGDPTYELYQFGYTDDMRTLLQFQDFTAVNNALLVDVTGNGCAETMGGRIFSGPGGQPTFVYAASVISGRSILVLPSSQVVNGERHSRILAALPEGSAITAHRAFVDYVVTEQGIATLHAKTMRERINELISVAHPDFRADLRKEAQRVYGGQA